MKTTDFTDVLQAKENRTKMQAVLREQYNDPVVCITVNIPGNIKYTSDIVNVIYHALDLFRHEIKKTDFTIKEERIFHHFSGPVACLAVAGDPQVIKRICIKIEEASKYGRLLDIDVFNVAGEPISRHDLEIPLRHCLVCNKAAVECMRERTHSAEVVHTAAQRLMDAFLAAKSDTRPSTVNIIGALALEAILLEAACAPAPGLVDRVNAGAHDDMDYFTFLKSSSAISTTLMRCAHAGWEHTRKPTALLPVLRHIGIEGEQSMMAATGGVNTQKGQLFLMGILTAAAALAAKNNTIGIIPVLDQVAHICAGLVSSELRPLELAKPDRRLSAGERLYVEYGVTGIRGEMEAGLPAVYNKGLPCFNEALTAGLSLNDALIHALIGLMTVVEDTTILNRHNMETLKEVQHISGQIMVMGGMLTSEGRTMIHTTDEYFSSRRISPGGSADLLAATYLLHNFSSRLSGD